MRFVFGLVGLGMLLGFGFIWVDLLRDLQAYPAAPTPMTVREAVSLEEPPRGSWVELTDVRFPCSMDEQRPGKSSYRLGFGETEADRIIVSESRPCSDTPVRVRGKLATASPGRIVDLEFRGYPWDQWPRAWQSTLWTSSGPEDARLGAWFLPPFALLGLLVMLFFWRPEPPRFTPLEQLTEGLTFDVDPGPVVPETGVKLAREWYGKLVTGGFVFTIIWLFGALTIFSVQMADSWALRVPLLVFFGGLTGFMCFAAYKMLRGWRAESELESLREWAVTPVIGFHDKGYGNWTMQWVHPVSGQTQELTYGAHEPRPLTFEGFCLVVWRGDWPIVVRERFVPFGMTPAEQRAAARRFIQHVRRKSLVAELVEDGPATLH